LYEQKEQVFLTINILNILLMIKNIGHIITNEYCGSFCGCGLKKKLFYKKVLLVDVGLIFIYV
jgi:hypothetical protein